jgi:ribosomal protein L2
MVVVKARLLPVAILCRRGVPCKGYRTRSNKRTDSMIVQRRHKR